MDDGRGARWRPDREEDAVRSEPPSTDPEVLTA
ncbi:protein of unknown function [Blastococcus saxobsidens DD2]|uniref:Uncharacterized protein n=1 Tax=Blastococcus saxobsidens (strain DD2) TaxID=1146883 RepID=H6RVA0_BLASD|nr:protein of unknown function [Blastococcus saxobsidens DD2]